ncbi:hypothetical protein L1887_16539 [Cichorium endivia]|nr:hypothetical protein L1887_16539 [Cichorium endivia]
MPLPMRNRNGMRTVYSWVEIVGEKAIGVGWDPAGNMNGFKDLIVVCAITSISCPAKAYVLETPSQQRFVKQSSNWGASSDLNTVNREQVSEKMDAQNPEKMMN